MKHKLQGALAPPKLNHGARKLYEEQRYPISGKGSKGRVGRERGRERAGRAGGSLKFIVLQLWGGLGDWAHFPGFSAAVPQFIFVIRPLELGITMTVVFLLSVGQV